MGRRGRGRRSPRRRPRPDPGAGLSGPGATGALLKLTPAQARRIALAAQGLARPRPSRPVTMRDVQGQIDRLAQFQIDSINVVSRAHYLPLYSRLGAYDTALLDRAAHRAPRRVFEYWGHAASLIDIRLQPALRFRMGRADREAWGRMRRLAAEQPDLVERVYTEIAAANTPVTAREIESTESERVREHWGWNWSEVKTSCEFLFWSGRVCAAWRNAQFERAYALPDRVITPEILARPTPDESESHRILVRRAAAALGIGTLGCFADYFRLGRSETAAAVASLERSGELVPARVTGWRAPVWVWAEARKPRQVAGSALLSPFDSMVFERTRLGALFGFDYRIEIYVPRAKRRYGYYVYPFLVGDRFVARLDLKADRGSDRLIVQAAWLEPGCEAESVSALLAAELTTMAGWLGLCDILVAPRGDLAVPLGRAL